MVKGGVFLLLVSVIVCGCVSTNMKITNAVRWEEYDEAERLIGKGADLNEPDERGDLPLHTALESDVDMDLIRLLLENGADVNLRDGDGHLPIYYVLRGYRDETGCIRLLTEYGLDVNCTLSNGDLLLKEIIEMAVYGNSEILTFMLERGMRLDAGTKHEDLLRRPIVENNREVIAILIDAGAQVTEENVLGAINLEDYDTALYLMDQLEEPTPGLIDRAVRSEGTEEVLIRLLERGTEPLADTLMFLVRRKNEDYLKLLLTSMETVPAELLTWAVSSGDLGQITMLLEAGGDINGEDSSGDTALDIAYYYRMGTEMFRFLIDRGADVNAMDKIGDMGILLHEARQCALDVEYINYLLDHGARTDRTDREGRNALFYVVEKTEDLELLSRLIDAGSSVDIVDEGGKSLLHYVLDTQPDNSELLTLLVEAGIDVTAADRDGTTPLALAARKGSVDAQILLLNAGALGNGQFSYEDFEAVIDRAFNEGNLSQLEQYVSVGLDLNSRDRAGTPLLFKAVRSCNLDMVNYFLDRGVDPNVTTESGHTTLFYLEEANSIAQALLEKGANIDHQDGTGSTALMAMLRFGSRYYYMAWNEMARFFIRHKAMLDIQDSDGYTALMIAAYNNHVEVVETLIRAGADVNTKDNDGWTALLLAEFVSGGWGHDVRIITLLGEAGAESFPRPVTFPVIEVHEGGA